MITETFVLCYLLAGLITALGVIHYEKPESLEDLFFGFFFCVGCVPFGLMILWCLWYEKHADRAWFKKQQLRVTWCLDKVFSALMYEIKWRK